MVEFASEVVPVIAPVKLDGDPQHAGFHFRASAVGRREDGEADLLHPSRRPRQVRRDAQLARQQGAPQLPWDAMCFVMGDKRYTMAYLDRPDNPKEARFSERDYGRFGSYFQKTLEKGDKLSVRYRLWLQEGEMKGDEIARSARTSTIRPKSRSNNPRVET